MKRKWKKNLKNKLRSRRGGNKTHFPVTCAMSITPSVSWKTTTKFAKTGKSSASDADSTMADAL